MGYIHGYSSTEQDRLYEQAKLFEQSTYKSVDFSQCETLLEVGCGVGAQTEILLKRFPKLKITAIDSSAEQLKQAAERLKPHIQSGHVTLQKMDAKKLAFPENSFDGAFICWFLEHVPGPVDVLHDVHRVLKPGGIVFANEVLNATLFVEPYSPALLKYWFQFNDQQWSLGGDPFVGAKLGNLFLEAGFRDIRTETISEYYDNRTPKMRVNYLAYCKDLFLSGAPELLKNGRVTQQDIDQMDKEFDELAKNPQSVYFYAWIQARAYAL